MEIEKLYMLINTLAIEIYFEETENGNYINLGKPINEYIVEKFICCNHSRLIYD